MSSLVNAIRDNLADKQLSSYEVDELLRIAEEGGISAQEVGEILNAFEAAGGITAARHARLWTRFTVLGATDALQALAARRPSGWTEVDAANEMRERFGYLLSEAASARSSLEGTARRLSDRCDEEALARGELVLRADLDEGDRTRGKEAIDRFGKEKDNAVRAFTALRSFLSDIDETKLQMIVAGAGSSIRWRWSSLEERIDGTLLTLLDASAKQALEVSLPALPVTSPAGGSNGFGGIEFASATAWTFDISEGRLNLPAGAEIKALPKAGEFTLRGERVKLPGGITLSGGARIVDGVLSAQHDAVLSASGLQMTATTSGARITQSRNTLIGGPGLRIDSPFVRDDGFPAGKAPATGDESAGAPIHETIRFSLKGTTLPDNTELYQGTGRMTVVTRAVEGSGGVLEGSLRLDPGARVVRRPTTAPLPIEGRAGQRGVLERGGAIMEDGELVGFDEYSEALIDGLKLRTGSRGDFHAYSFKAPGRYSLPKGATVTALPADREVTLTGEELSVRIGDAKVQIASGSATFKGGKLVAVERNSIVVTPQVRITTQEGRVAVLDEVPGRWPSGSAIAVTKDAIEAAGPGFSFTGGADGLLPAPDARFFGLPARVELQMLGGKVSIKKHEVALSPAQISVDVKGAAKITVGAWAFEAGIISSIKNVGGEFSGPPMQIKHGKDIHEIDTRPMWGSLDPKTDPGRVRRVGVITSERFRAVRSDADEVLSGRRKLTVGARGEIIKHVQTTLMHFLDTHLDVSGALDAPTVAALQTFQRLHRLERTGSVDAATMRALDEAAPPLSLPSAVRAEGRFGGALHAQAQSIASGKTELRAHESSGEMVRRIQETIAETLGVSVNADGQFGPRTAQLVRDFQARHGLPQTGAVDAVTMGKLLELHPTTARSGSQGRRKVMVMMALNSDVPDELKRFRELAAERGAEPIIIGLPDSDRKDVTELQRFFARAERGEIDLDWLVISGHSGGHSTWGSNGTLDYGDLAKWAKLYPRAAAQVEKLILLNCYNVTRARAETYWPTIFPNVTGMAGFMYSAPGKQAQSSDEHMLNSGRLMMQIPKGHVADRATAERIGAGYVGDRFISVQNASMWVRYRDEQGKDDIGHFVLTRAADYETRRHGASAALELIPSHLREAFEGYFEAASDQFAEPPAQHHSGPLREYLNAVDTVLGSARARLTEYQRFVQRRDAHEAEHRRIQQQERAAGRDYTMPAFPTPPEFEGVWGMESQVQEVEQLRARVLFLIYHGDVRKFFAEKYGRNIQAFNELLAGRGISKRFPAGEELKRMTRKDVLAMLRDMRQALESLPSNIRDRPIEDDAWQMMRATDPTDTAPASPEDFLERARAFLGEMDATYIRAEWL